MNETPGNTYDVIVSGAGPTGLTAAILLAREGLKVLVCEKGEHPAPLPRGETIHDHPILDKVLGTGFMESIAIHKTAKRRFFSPDVQKSFDLERKTESIVFQWEDFISQLYAQASQAGVEFRFNAETSAPIMEKDICSGVRLTSGDDIYGKTLIVSDGHNSHLGKTQHIPYDTLNCPIVKRLISNYNGDYEGFAYYYLAAGMLEFAPKFPPAVIFVFPREEGKCEVGLMVLASVIPDLKKEVSYPNDWEMLRIFHKLIETHPHFSELMKNTRTDLEYATQVTTAKMHKYPVPIPGMIFLGDAAGFVEASGASGISCSMQEAEIVAEFLVSQKDLVWNHKSRRACEETLLKSEIYQKIRRKSKKTRFGLSLIFGEFKTAKNINQSWKIVERMYKL